MIAYVATGPTIEPHNGSFLVTFKSGETETQMLLTLHSLTLFNARAMHCVREAQMAQSFEPIPCKPKRAKR